MILEEGANIIFVHVIYINGQWFLSHEEIGLKKNWRIKS
jgi:hypothetical protein